MVLFNVLTTILVLIPFCTGIIVFRRSDMASKVLIYFLAFIIITEVYGVSALFLEIEFSWSFHIYTLGEFFFMVYMLSFWQSSFRKRQLLLLTLPAYFLIWLAAKFSIESWSYMDNYTASFASVILVALAAYTLINLESKGAELHRDHRFWICCTVLLYHSGNFLALAFMNIIEELYAEGFFIFPIHSTLRIIRYVGFTAGLLCFLPRPIFSGARFFKPR